MDNENTSKLSEMASFEVKDTDSAKLLICYLLYKIEKLIEAQQLYDIAVGSGIINYFCYNDAIESLLKNETITIEKNDGGRECYINTDKGIVYAKNFRTYVPKSMREKIIRTAMKYLAKIKIENEVKIEYIPLEKGYHVHFRCLDIGDDLLDMKIFAPDLTQAHFLGERIMRNPAGLYAKIVSSALDNEEEEHNYYEFFDENDI
jgi:hypothetical protein